MRHENSGEIISFPNVNPEHMEDDEILDLFLSSLLHPSVSKKPDDLAEIIIESSGNKHTESDEVGVYAQRVLGINDKTGFPSDKEWDDLTIPDQENYDQPFVDIVEALRIAVHSDDPVRSALFILHDTRLSALRLNVDADGQHITQLVALLVKKYDAT